MGVRDSDRVHGLRQQLELCFKSLLPEQRREAVQSELLRGQGQLMPHGVRGHDLRLHRVRFDNRLWHVPLLDLPTRINCLLHDELLAALLSGQG